MKKVLVTAQIPKEGLNLPPDRFEVYCPGKEMLTYKEVLGLIGGYHAVIAVGVAMDRRMLKAAENLKLIANYGVGYDKVDVGYATEKGVAVANTPTSVTEATAELAYGLMSSLVRRISLWDGRVRRDENTRWGRMNNSGHTLYGKTLGIIGMGRIGRSMARRALAGGMRICYYNRSRLPAEFEDSLGAVYLQLKQLLEVSDVISVHTPLTPETRHMIGENEFSAMKTGVYVINTARGAVMDEQALIRHIKAGKVAGAALDVFENEPYINPELMELDQVVLTPHIGTDTCETNIEITREAVQSILEYFDGQIPANIVNPEVFPG